MCQTLLRDWAGGKFLAHQRNVVLLGGTGTGKSHFAIAIASACIHDGARGRFFYVVDLVNRLEAETRSGRQGRMADYLCRMDFVVLDELGYLQLGHSGSQLLWSPRLSASSGAPTLSALIRPSFDKLDRRRLRRLFISNQVNYGRCAPLSGRTEPRTGASE